jgi:DNA modification methylase
MEFVDCLGPDGMPNLQDNEFELCFSDPPWGYEYDGTNPKGINQQTYHPERENYNDEFNPDFNLQFFQEMNRTCKATVIIMGRLYLFWWIRNTQPLDLFTLTFKNGQNSTKISKYNATCHYLCYGKQNRFWIEHKFHRNHYETYITNGFLRDKEYTYTHPSPKDFKTWEYMLNELKPASVLDPFGGSGTIGEVCESLGIKWLAFEIKEDYYTDAKYRIEKGMQRYSNLKKLGSAKNLMEL